MYVCMYVCVCMCMCVWVCGWTTDGWNWRDRHPTRVYECVCMCMYEYVCVCVRVCWTLLEKAISRQNIVADGSQINATAAFQVAVRLVLSTPFRYTLTTTEFP